MRDTVRRVSKPAQEDHPPAANQRGAALFVVLLFCAFLTGLVGVAMQGATSGARAATVFFDEMQADELGRGAADAVAYRVQTGGPAEQRGGSFSIHLGDADIDVDYRSESARVDINTAPIDLITSVLAVAGADQSVLEAVTASITATRGSKTPALVHPAAEAGSNRTSSLEDDSQTATGTPSKSKADGFQQPLEAVGVWHLPDEVTRRVLPALTAANGTAKVDPTLADRLVLSALLGGDDARVDDFIQRRQQGFVDQGSALALLPVTMQPHAGFSDVSAVRALVLVTVAHRFKRRYEIILDPPAFAGQAPNVLFWHPVF